MAWRITRIKKLLIGAVTVCFLISIYLGSSSLPKSSVQQLNRNAEHDIRFPGNIYEPHHQQGNLIQSESHVSFTSKYHLAVIVPFRDRFEELLTFTPYLHRYLNEKQISHNILVVNQVDTYRFNRASLINVGFGYAMSSKAEKSCDYIAMHDVDLLPLNKDLPYDLPEAGSVMHVAGPGLHPKYNYPSFIGGILLVRVNDFKEVNGMSNVYWGWGMEDDEFFVRLKQNNIKVKRPTGLNSGKKDTFRHIHSPKIRPRDTIKCFDQFNKTKRRDRLTGLNNLNYTFISSSNMTIDDAPVTILNVKLHCNTHISPWCDCGGTNHTGQNKTSVSTIDVKKHNKKSNNDKFNQNIKNVREIKKRVNR